MTTNIQVLCYKIACKMEKTGPIDPCENMRCIFPSGEFKVYGTNFQENIRTYLYTFMHENMSYAKMMLSVKNDYRDYARSIGS